MILLDFILLTPLIFGIIRGLFNGLVKELLSIAAVIIGIFLAYNYTEKVESILSTYINLEGASLTVLSYLLIFGFVLLISFALSFIVTKFLQALSLGILNRIFGGVFGFGKALLVVLVIINLIHPYIESSTELVTTTSQSQVYQALMYFNTAFKDVFTNDLSPTLPGQSMAY